MGVLDLAMAMAKQQLHAVERNGVKAEFHRDAASLRLILDPAFIYADGVGASIRREGFIHAFVTGSSRRLPQTLGETTMVTRGDTAIVAGLDTIVGRRDGKTRTNVFRHTVTCVRRHGHGVALAEHMLRRKE